MSEYGCDETYEGYGVYIKKDQIYFEHEHLGEDDSCCVYLEHGRIYDYDMCFAMPNEVGQWLSKEGYNVYWDGDFWDYD